MKIVIAPDAFKGSLSSSEVISIITQSAHAQFKNADVVGIPIADGGDGTVDALTAASGGHLHRCAARDPLGRSIDCIYGAAGDTAIVGMSECSGLALLSVDERNPLEASSHGVGDIIISALDDGFSNILLGIGGSATNDGGTGAMQALGMRFIDSSGNDIPRMSGQQLINIARIDTSGLDKRLNGTSITIMCDVTNPLTGKNGATYIYGPQKRGSPDVLGQLETGMLHYEQLINAYAGKPISLMPGAGAAGGIGCTMHGFAGAELVRGIDAVLSLVQFDKLIADADVIITGEGRVDRQSAYGKVVHGVATYAKAANVPLIVIAGSVGDGADAVYALGVDVIVPLPGTPMTLEYCIENAAALLRDAADRAFSLIKVGQKIK